MSASNAPVRETALVLHTIRHGDTSRIATLFGRTRGKFAVIAKGARSVKKGAAGNVLEPPNLIEALVYFKPTRNVQTLGSASIINAFPGLADDLTLRAYTAVIVEQLNRVFSDLEPNEGAFNTAIAGLSDLERRRGNPRVALWRFQLALLRLAGFGLEPLACPVCGRDEAVIGSLNLLWLETGAVCCAACRPQGGNCIPISGEAVGIIRHLTRNPPREADASLYRLKPSRPVRRELTNLLTRFLKFHHPSLGPLPALEMLDQFDVS